MKFNISDILIELDSLGYSKIEKLLSPVEVNKVKILVNYHYDKINNPKKVIYPGVPNRNTTDKIVYNLQNKDKYFIDLLFKDSLREIGIKKLNDEHYRFLPAGVPNYNLLYYNARSGGSKLDLHIDSGIPYQGNYTMKMQWMFILDDFRENNGCTVVAPGSHQSGTYTNRNLTNLTPIIANAGDVIVWDSRLWHGCNENIEKSSRWSLIATLGMWFLKPSMDITKSLPQEIYEKLTDEQKSVMCFCSIPPRNEFERNNTKCGYDFLKDNVKEYFEE